MTRIEKKDRYTYLMCASLGIFLKSKNSFFRSLWTFFSCLKQSNGENILQSSKSLLRYGNTGNNNKLVLPHCCKTRWKARLPVLPPLNKTCLATNQVVATWFLARQVWTWVVKRDGQHHFLTSFAALLQKKLHVFNARLTVTLAMRHDGATF